MNILCIDLLKSSGKKKSLSTPQALDHPNIIKLYEVFYNEDDAHLVQEYTSGDDLYSRSPYSERDAARIASQLISAVAHMVRPKDARKSTYGLY